MGIFGGQFANVVEWNEFKDDVIFHKWSNNEIKKGSKLILRAGQDAIFMYNGKIEGIFKDEGEYNIETDIIPFLSTLKGFKFGFNSGLRAEVLFVNTKEFTEKWGTKNPVVLAAPQLNLPGGLPIRAFGNYSFKVDDYITLIDKLAGVRTEYRVEDVKLRVSAVVDQLLMKWIATEGKDIFNLQAYSLQISAGIKSDLDMELCKLGFNVTDFNIASVSYPEEVTRMQNKAAAQAMVGDMNKYTNISMADGMSKGGSSLAGDMVGASMGMALGSQMVNSMNNANQGANAGLTNPTLNGQIPKFCPNCGTPTTGTKFCGNCGTKLI
ncbi:SPFH domain-containing protein [Lachnospira pectinoschiza]|uniref:Membrane protease subunit, stomatin/prohibitin family, contains C-terminal Zn-ribbon domain n=1 Tax=Lachnospira pectinoschiza TaxID=28052 RepID=A0A1G9TV57_9FIRM|nr:SPFH domain-containing protein [Lachnospira pectinoschiza]SDM51619.1 Membrane protease subunit, stomatin/prohibitin family, contains C-terminal Zn-ribbon domain [Lachnospira pectinoschiza]